MTADSESQRTQRSQDEKIDWLCANIEEMQKAIYKGNGKRSIMSRLDRLEVLAGFALFVAGAALSAALPQIFAALGS